MVAYKILIIKTIVIVFTALSFSVLASEITSPEVTVISYLTALTKGDTKRIKEVLDYSYFRKRKVLLENNPSYTRFLKSYHKGMQFRVLSSIKENTRAYVRVEQSFADGNKINITISLKKIDSENWKISEEIISP